MVLIKLFLKSGMSVDQIDSSGQTALHKAAYHGNLQIVELLLKSGANINTPTVKVQATPLHTAVAGRLEPATLGFLYNDPEEDQGEDQVISLLLQKGANIDAQDIRGRTALHEAVWNGYRPVVKLLVDRGARTDLKDKDGNTSHSIAMNGSHPSMKGIVRETTASTTPDLGTTLDSEKVDI